MMLKVTLPIIVEGKYDKIKLSSFLEATIITTDGFGIFKSKDKVRLIKKLAEKDGIIVLTDSDSAGSIIRSYLKNIIGEEKIYNVFLPEVKGKEKRKTKESSEGFLGVEGISKEVIISALERFLKNKDAEKEEEITKAFLMSVGLSGGENSSRLRKELLRKLDLPTTISPNTLIKVLNDITTKEEILDILSKLG